MTTRAILATLLLATAAPVLADDAVPPAAPTPPPAPSAAAAPAPAPAPEAAALEAPPAQAGAPLTLMPLATVKPEIPDALCQQRASGWVDLDFAVLNDGKVMDVKVVAAEPPGAFDAAAAQAVAARTYPPQPAPRKVHERLPLSWADCRSEQLRAQAAAAADAAAPQECAGLAAQARSAGDLIDSAEAGRAVLQGEEAQAYSAPSARCALSGRKLKSGARLAARVEYQGFSLVSARQGTDEFWVRSNELKDTAP